MNNKFEAYIGWVMADFVKTSAYKNAMNARDWSILWLDHDHTVLGFEEIPYRDERLIEQKVKDKKLNAFILGFGNAPYAEVGIIGFISRYFRSMD